ncbi:glycosyltransferase family 2 protein [Legionella israelensis]|uniref:Glycosyltransferase family 2 protein n=1 Tax=Legionella israelensis TaxID=454 RepID=A0AAX1ECS1_9GAMM|nr:glycosyltransferase [Legionella israelensis]QBR82883.1 glycosyltransferase family 2 protein [Legionella israelensis]
MTDFIYQIIYYLMSIFASNDVMMFIFIFFPFIVLIELPFHALTLLFAIKGWLKMQYTPPSLRVNYYPIVTVVITAYNETWEELYISIQAVAEQLYPGKIETLLIIDNAVENMQTVASAHQIAKIFDSIPNRTCKVIEKKARGGHASSMNLGLKLAKGEVLIMLDADTSIDNQTVTKAAAHFRNPNVIAVSGALRVRNIRSSILTRLQSIEYMIGIQLGRFGLTELHVTNNISGAFGIFRTGFLKQIGGWLNGTAEDLDLTLRIHVYASRYPHLKIIHEPYAIAWTTVPVSLRRLLKQRLRWDGDLFYIYVRRHWRKFSSSLMSRARLFFFSWYGLYYQLVLPFVLVFYTVLLIFTIDLAKIIAVFLLVYSYYLIMSGLLYIFFLLLVSERSRQDFTLIGWLLLMPLYQLFLRFMAMFFILNEIMFKGHQETSMAPWWVIRKTK